MNEEGQEIITVGRATFAFSSAFFHNHSRNNAVYRTEAEIALVGNLSISIRAFAVA